MRLHRAASTRLSPALLLAGLVLCAPLGAEEAPPGRSIVPAEALAPAREIEALRRKVEQFSQAFDERQQAQARQLSRSAAALDALQAERGGVQGALDGLRQRAGQLDERLKALEAGGARVASDLAGTDSRVSAAQKDLDALRRDLGDARDSLQGGLKDVGAARAELKERGEKLASLTDLLSAMKRELDSNNEELVELRLAVKSASAPARPQVGGSEWWDRALHWKYLPAVAVGLSAVAIGVAASR